MFYKNEEYPTEIKNGHYINYELDVNRGETGTLGVDMPPISERRGLILTMPNEIFFNNNVHEATHNAEFILKMHTTKKSSLFHGVFKDVITVTIKDL